MTRLVLGLAALLAACGGSTPQSGNTPQSEPPVPTRQCSNASCCGGGWLWNVLDGCTPLMPPFCGCYCSGPEPTVYETLEECRAAPPRGLRLRLDLRVGSKLSDAL